MRAAHSSAHEYTRSFRLIDFRRYGDADGYFAARGRYSIPMIAARRRLLAAMPFSSAPFMGASMG